MSLTANTGISLNELLAKFSDDEAKKITNAIRLAHYESLPNSKLVQMIRGSKAQRYQDGILATSTRHAKTIANTGTAIMASQAKQQFIKDNKDTVRGIKVVATLDLRTSAICRHLDGEFMPIERAKFPPYYFNCRSSFEIVYDGYIPPKQRTSMNGVVENQTYYEWLKAQDKADIQQVLGKKKSELFLSDGMTAEKFKQLQFDRIFLPMSLKELIKAENVTSIAKPSYQIVSLQNLRPRQSEVVRLQHEPIKRGEKPKTPRPAEAELADLLQQYFGIYLVRYDDRYHKSSPIGNPPDFAQKDNDLPVKNWQTLDMMFTMLADDIKGIVAMNYTISEHKRHARNWRVLQEQIIEHIEKSELSHLIYVIGIMKIVLKLLILCYH